jgi:hypothetical protein
MLTKVVDEHIQMLWLWLENAATTTKQVPTATLTGSKLGKSTKGSWATA